MRRILIIIVTVVSLCLTVRAQERLFVCHHDSCEVYEMVHINSINFMGDSLRVDGQSPYSTAQVDSIVFKHPVTLIIEKRGWWDDMCDGESRFLTVLTVNNNNYSFDYHVRFTFTANDSICQTAVCKVMFDEKWHILAFFDSMGIPDPSSPGDGGGDPYIYVKETLTGPRRFETWEMDNPVLPKDCMWEVVSDSLLLRSDCSAFLTGRPMSEVKQIVETWLFKPAVKKENPNYHENNN